MLRNASGKSFEVGSKSRECLSNVRPGDCGSDDFLCGAHQILLCLVSLSIHKFETSKATPDLIAISTRITIDRRGHIQIADSPVAIVVRHLDMDMPLAAGAHLLGKLHPLNWHLVSI